MPHENLTWVACTDQGHVFYRDMLTPPALTGHCFGVSEDQNSKHNVFCAKFVQRVREHMLIEGASACPAERVVEVGPGIHGWFRVEIDVVRLGSHLARAYFA